MAARSAACRVASTSTYVSSRSVHNPHLSARLLHQSLPSVESRIGQTRCLHSTSAVRAGDPAIDQLKAVFNSRQHKEVKQFYFHVYAHKHNTHITVCGPDRNPLPGLSLSAGNLGFRKAGRSQYDAAYQLASYTIGRMLEKGMLNEIGEMELILRGFGTGREAVTKAILGQEGQQIRSKITRVTDSTRLKFGGTRSEKPRRLG